MEEDEEDGGIGLADAVGKFRNQEKTKIIDMRHKTKYEFSANTKGNLVEENKILKEAIKAIYDQCGDGRLNQKWIGWESGILKEAVNNTNLIPLHK